MYWEIFLSLADISLLYYNMWQEKNKTWIKKIRLHYLHSLCVCVFPRGFLTQGSAVECLTGPDQRNTTVPTDPVYCPIRLGTGSLISPVSCVHVFPVRKQEKKNCRFTCVGFPVKADVKRHVQPFVAEFTRCRMNGIVFVRVQCETLKAIPLVLGGNDLD